jgi:hypothetical protein
MSGDVAVKPVLPLPSLSENPNPHSARLSGLFRLGLRYYGLGDTKGLGSTINTTARPP